MHKNRSGKFILDHPGLSAFVSGFVSFLLVVAAWILVLRSRMLVNEHNDPHAIAGLVFSFFILIGGVIFGVVAGSTVFFVLRAKSNDRLP